MAAPKRRRRAVEGPDAVADDLARAAMGIAGDLSGAAIEAAVIARADDPDDAMRAACWSAPARRDAAPSPDVTEAGLHDPLPVVRMAALKLALDAGPQPDMAARARRRGRADPRRGAARGAGCGPGASGGFCRRGADHAFGRR